jgi:pyocin large subunit-like protein
MIKRPTARQAAESSAAKQSVAAAEGTQAHALERKAIEEAKVKLPCPDAAKTPLWTSTESKSAVENAFEHWKKHGAEFPEFQNSNQYWGSHGLLVQRSPLLCWSGSLILNAGIADCG